jgi:hypothetical protein
MVTPGTEDKYAVDFDPREYLNEYYLVEPEIEDIFVVEFMVTALRDMPANLLTLEFGGGPTLFAVAALVSQSREIHFCDYVAASLDEVQRWLDKETDTFNWDPYIKLALEKEGKPTTPEAIAERAAEMRRKVTRLTTCDALARAPLGQSAIQYDLVVAQAVTDTAAKSVREWMQIMGNISTLVRPGGWLLISVLTGTSGYIIGQKRFPCVDLSDDEIYRGYMAAGYYPDTFRLEKLDAPGERGYSGVVSVSACKLMRPTLEP